MLFSFPCICKLYVFLTCFLVTSFLFCYEHKQDLAFLFTLPPVEARKKESQEFQKKKKKKSFVLKGLSLGAGDIKSILMLKELVLYEVTSNILVLVSRRCIKGWL